MKKVILIFSSIILSCCIACNTYAQCAMCTKTAQQLGEGPAQGLNSGILYLMLAPFALVGVIGVRWWKNNKLVEEQENAGLNS
jgi:hypothetical protein